MATRYWVGGSATWNAANTTPWAEVSGGAGGKSAPTVLDSVVFDANSGLTSSQTVTIAAGAACLNITVEGLGEVRPTFNQSAAFEPAGVGIIKGKSEAFQIFWKSSVTGTARVFKISAITLANVDFADIKAEGAAAPFVGENLGDALGNSGITLTEGETQTRKGAGGNYSDPTKWSGRVPMPQDDVKIGNEASGTITMDMPRLGRKVDFTGFAGTAKFSTAPSVYGSLLFAAGMTLEGTATITLAGRSAGLELKTAGKELLSILALNGPGGEYTLVEALKLNAKGVSIAMGTLKLNGKNITCSTFAVTNKLGSVVCSGPSTITLTSTAAGTIWNSTLNTEQYVFVNGKELTIIIANASANERSFDGLGEIYGALIYNVAGSTGTLKINLTAEFITEFFELAVSDANNARTIIFTAKDSVRVNKWNIKGSAGKLVKLESTSAGNRFILYSTLANVDSNYLAIKDSEAVTSTPTNWYAGAKSENLGNNVGWKFENRKVDGEATLTGTGSISIKGSVRRNAAATLTGAGAISLSGSVRKSAEAVLSASGSITVKGVRRVSGAVDLLGQGEMTETGVIVYEGEVSSSSTGSLSVMGSVRRNSDADMSAKGECEVKGSVRVNSSAELDGAGQLEVLVVKTYDGEATLEAFGTLEAEGFVPASYHGGEGGSYELGEGSEYKRVEGSAYDDSEDFEYAEAVSASPRTSGYEQ